MKQCLYNGWCAFRAWVLFNYWRHCTNENHDELLKFYILKRWEKNAMNAYVKFHDGKRHEPFVSLYIGNIPHDWENRINDKILREKELRKKRND